MNKKIVAFLFLSVLSLVYSNEKTDKNNFFEFNIGFAMNHFGYFTLEYIKDDVYYTEAEDSFEAAYEVMLSVYCVVEE